MRVRLLGCPVPSALSDQLPVTGTVTDPNANLAEWAFVDLDRPLTYRGQLVQTLMLVPKFIGQRIGDPLPIGVNIVVTFKGEPVFNAANIVGQGTCELETNAQQTAQPDTAHRRGSGW